MVQRVNSIFRVVGVILTVTLLLAVFVRPAQAAVSASHDEQTDDATLICLALVIGAALLAVGMWAVKVRRMPSWRRNLATSKRQASCLSLLPSKPLQQRQVNPVGRAS